MQFAESQLITKPKLKPQLMANSASALAPLTMDEFLADIEKKAYHMALLATGVHADALDLLQDSMIKLVTNYQNKPAEQWKPLFYKILQNRIRDWHRHQKVKNLLFFWRNDDIEECQTTEQYELNSNKPEQAYAKSKQQQAAIVHLQQLSGKQQQCFLLRSWEGLSVAETAQAMGCSQGSVKTHYSRATHKLRELMEDDNEITF